MDLAIRCAVDWIVVERA